MKKFASLACVLAFALVLAGCAKKIPLTEDNKMFAGKWVAADNTWVQIYLDGGGDFQMSNSNVKGGGATIADGNLTIALGPIKKVFKIDQTPKDVKGKMVLKLDGVDYTKE